MKLQNALLPILLGLHIVLINANHMQAEFSRSQQATLGQSIGNFGHSTGNIDQSSGNFGQSSDNFGIATENFGLTSDNFGLSTGNFGQSTGPFDQASGNFVQSSGNFGQTTGSVDQSSGISDRSSGNFGQSFGQFEQSFVNSGQRSTGNFGQSTGNFGQSTDNLGQSTSNFGQQQSTGNFGQQSRRLMGPSNFAMSAPSTVDFFNSNLQLDNIMPSAEIGPSANARIQGMGQGGGRSRGGRHQMMTPRRGVPNGGIQEDPDFIRRILGSTTIGRELRMGELGLPRHGGAGQGERHANGLLDGWDGNPQTLQQVSRGWADPFRGQPIPQVPIGFSGNFGAISGFSAFSNRLFR
ncbi:uncharacterized protein LOC127879554 [Dreissena polymorpha]|uniref:Uncharacterized protein n=1 Tax=Dreissena polymorpha TaxID=45954 RepID=A0A9D4KKK9_DREPO|nr:uncharacterized protein LOC127879554 [Dreissena polymorpha]KAH3841209.1 hypothetical protein DPMN_114667 [Dreissena polymorpha]